MTEDLKKIFRQHIELDESEIERIQSLWEIAEYEESEYLVRANNIEKYFYYILDGVQRLYFVDQKGEEKILGFSFKGSFSGELSSFKKQEPTSLNLQAILKTKALRISRRNWENMFLDIPKLQIWYNSFLEGILFGRINREREIQSLGARERFKNFHDRMPKQLLSIPQKYIASYLGMTPETYSRLRAEKIS